MKLWQKIFLISLLFIVLSTEGITLFALTSNFNRTLERQIGQAVREHSFISASISNNLVYERLRQNKIVLPEDEVVAAITEITGSQFSDNRVSIYGDKGAVSNDLPQLKRLPDFKLAVQNSSQVLSYIYDQDGTISILVGAQTSFEHHSYTVYTATDVTALYRTHTDEIRFAVLMGIALALCVSGVLLAVVFALLSPLRKTNRLLGEIAAGNYSLRLPESGGYEFRELSRNINTMADSIEENVRSLESTAESRKRFIDNLAHEMKTPLTSILGFSDILRVKKDVTEKERREYASIVVEETKRLKNLSGKLLELATSDHVSLDFEQMNIRELFHEINIAVLPILSKNHIRLECKPLNKNILVDRELFKSLLYNLIDNAVKASEPESRIELYSQEQDGHILICIRDYGVGISREQLSHITEPFYMADKSRSRKVGGVGLGLSLCLEIAKQHGAKIKISSALGQGTLVTITMKGEGRT